MKLIQSFKSNATRGTSGKITVEVDDIFKLFTRSYIEQGDPDFWLMDKDEAALAISAELPYGMSIRWQEGLERFQVCATEHPWDDEDCQHYCKRHATVEELKELIPADMVSALESLQDATLEF